MGKDGTIATITTHGNIALEMSLEGMILGFCCRISNINMKKAIKEIIYFLSK